MIKIYVCEDNQTQLDYISSTINKYLLMAFEEEYSHFFTTDPYNLLKECRQMKESGLYFLDIDLKSDINGLDLASKIRQYDPRGYIVFITAHNEMLPLTFQYKVEALDFILKDEPEKLNEKIVQCIQRAIEIEKIYQSKTTNLLPIKINNTILQLNQDDIVMIKSDETPHKLIIHTTQGIKKISGSLKDIQPSLDSCFYRCHNSAIVNIKHVKKYRPENRILELDNGETCPVSFRFSKIMRNVLSNH